MALGRVAACVVFFSLVSVATGKKKETALVISEVKPYIGCDICHGLVEQSIHQTEVVRQNVSASGRKLTEDRILDDVVDSLCNPHTEVGGWLRKATWRRSSEGQIEFEFADRFGKCKRQCWTAAEVCDAIVASDDADQLPGLLLRGAPAAKVRQATCPSACKRQKEAVKRVKPTTIRPEWCGEAFEEIDSKEKEIEEMMERMALGPNGGQSADVFTRSEMDEIQAAMSAGDLDRLQELDPTYTDLDENSFAALRRMTGEESGAETHSSREVEPTMPSDVANAEVASPWTTVKSWFGL